MEGSSAIQVQILPPPFISSVILHKLLNLQISGLRSPFYLKRSLQVLRNVTVCVVMPMRWLRLLSAVGNHHTLVFGPLENWPFVYCSGSQSLCCPSQPYNWEQVECVWGGVLLHFLIPHTVEWHRDTSV